MYSWLVFVHVLGVFGFLLTHGAAIALTFTLRGERKVERLRALLQLSKSTAMWTNVFLAVVLVTGIAAGFLGHWWGHYWIWVALGVLVLLSVAMNLFGRRPFDQLRMAVERAGTDGAPSEAVGDEQKLADALRSFHPLLLTLIGGIGLAVILWLMMFKPF